MQWPLGLRAPAVKRSEFRTAILMRPAGQGLGGVQSARTSQGQEGTWEAPAAMPWGSPPEMGVGGWKEQLPSHVCALRSSTCWSYCRNVVCVCVCVCVGCGCPFHLWLGVVRAEKSNCVPV